MTDEAKALDKWVHKERMSWEDAAEERASTTNFGEQLFGPVTYTMKGGELVGRASKSRAIGSRPGGLEIETGPDGFERVCETFTCQHCNHVVDVKPFCSPSDIEFGGQCKGCMGLICLTCYDKAECKPIEKWCEEQERKGRFRAQLTG